MMSMQDVDNWENHSTICPQSVQDLDKWEKLYKWVVCLFLSRFFELDKNVQFRFQYVPTNLM